MSKYLSILRVLCLLSLVTVEFVITAADKETSRSGGDNFTEQIEELKKTIQTLKFELVNIGRSIYKVCDAASDYHYRVIVGYIEYDILSEIPLYHYYKSHEDCLPPKEQDKLQKDMEYFASKAKACLDDVFNLNASYAIADEIYNTTTQGIPSVVKECENNNKKSEVVECLTGGVDALKYGNQFYRAISDKITDSLDHELAFENSSSVLDCVQENQGQAIAQFEDLLNKFCSAN